MEVHILVSASSSGAENYEAAVLAAGGIPHAAYCPADRTEYDGLLLCGGGDIDPCRFGQENWASSEIDPQRDASELALAASYLAAGKPVLGICRGLQILNVALGGTLLQDIGSTQVCFHTHAPGSSEDKVHAVHAEEGSLLERWYGPVFSVNSAHHQALDRIGEGLAVTARSESGLVEAVEHTALPVLALQYHPERMTGAHRRMDTVDGAPVFQWLIEQCRNRLEGR